MNVTSANSQFYQSGTTNRMPPPPPPSGGGAPEDTEDIFSSIDSDESGGLTAEEIGNSMLSHFFSEDTFATFDEDGSGTLSLDELQAHRDSVMAEGTPGVSTASVPVEADPMAMFEAMLENVSNSDFATEATASYAEDLYTAMQNLLGSFDT